jgi:hypothetical protein
MAMKNKSAKKTTRRKTKKGANKPKKLVISKRDIEVSLANMESWCFMLRQALEAYDGKTDKAVLYSPWPPPPPIHVNPEVMDCPPTPPEEGCCACCCSLTPEMVELLTEYLKAWKRKNR